MCDHLSLMLPAYANANGGSNDIQDAYGTLEVSAKYF
ncbi:hypothetical protein GMOD_00004065 [Pyrenophora seminiperda CCB06]|uniref:Uncharacterized protein n=1 Tax=Pyrenophora seminiperda CCB06 TaxID=1302712 RepID=A0A3M7M0K6_9PLEO|nr:hypothetical protein GMOD_00004065 [Pyrenophora seminiperda CCB06]